MTVFFFVYLNEGQSKCNTTFGSVYNKRVVKWCRRVFKSREWDLSLPKNIQTEIHVIAFHFTSPLLASFYFVV